MRLLTLISILLFVICSSAFSQTNLTIGIHSGIMFSAFEDQEETQNAIPVGGYLGMQVSENLEIGAEFSVLALAYEEEYSEDGITVTQGITQNAFGIYTKIYFPSETIVPYLRGGLGYYTGAIEFSSGGASVDFNFEGAVGFNIGAGIGTESGIYAEFIYHIVSQKLEDFDGDSAGLNNFGVHVGYAFAIN
jgi:hypothetical protein